MKKTNAILISLLATIAFFGLGTGQVAAAKLHHYDLRQVTKEGVSHGPCYEATSDATRPVELEAYFIYGEGDEAEYFVGKIRTIVNHDDEELLFVDQNLPYLHPLLSYGWLWRESGTYEVSFYEIAHSGDVNFIASRNHDVKESCDPGEILNPKPTIPPVRSSTDPTNWKLCNQIPANNEKASCLECLDKPGVWTAVGCIPTQPTRMIRVLVEIGLMIGGGVALLIILAGSFVLSTSQGDPKKTSEAKEMITSALIGLVFIIFSVSILQLIGVQILQIPGFGD